MRGETTNIYWPVVALYAVAFSVGAVPLLGLFHLPYTGLKDGALVFLPGDTDAFVFGLFFVMTLGLLIPFMSLTSLGEIVPWTLPMLAAYVLLGVALFAWARQDYIALYPDHILVHEQRGPVRYSYDEVIAVELACVSRGTGKGRWEDLVYDIEVRGNTTRNMEWIDLARRKSWQFDNGTAGAIANVEKIHPILRAHGVAFSRGQIDPACMEIVLRQVKGDETRLRALGWLD